MSDLSTKTQSAVSGGTGVAVRSASIHNKKSLWGYRSDDDSPFIKIVINDQKFLPKVRDELPLFACPVLA